MPKVLVTGATGFVGGALADRLQLEGWEVVRGARHARNAHGWTRFELPEGLANSGRELFDVDAIVHAAALVHVSEKGLSGNIAEFRRMNVDGTRRLAQQAAAAGVGRFVFLSSIKVNGENSLPGRPFSADDVPAPTDPYGISKHQAEEELIRIGKDAGMDVVVVRPPLVYGPGVKANFLSLMRWIERGIPLPLGAVPSKRSLVGLENLVSLLVTCLEAPGARNEVFLAGDDESLSVTELLEQVGVALGKPARLVPVPPRMLRFGAAMVGKSHLAARLCGALEVDIGKTRDVLGWRPPVSVEDGIRETAEWYARAICRRPI